MFIVNVTFNASIQVFETWRKYAVKYFIPQSMKDGGFSKYKVIKVLLDDDQGTQTYSIQFYAENPIRVDNYLREIFPDFQDELIQTFGEQVVVFATPLKETTLD